MGGGPQATGWKQTRDSGDDLVLEVAQADLFDSRLGKEESIQTGRGDDGPDREAAQCGALVFGATTVLAQDLRTS